MSDVYGIPMSDRTSAEIVATARALLTDNANFITEMVEEGHPEGYILQEMSWIESNAFTEAIPEVGLQTVMEGLIVRMCVAQMMIAELRRGN